MGWVGGVGSTPRATEVNTNGWEGVTGWGENVLSYVRDLRWC